MAKQIHFPDGVLKLKCLAEIKGVWSAHIDGTALGGGGAGAGHKNGGYLNDRGVRQPNRLLDRDAGELQARLILAESMGNLMLSFLNSQEVYRRRRQDSSCSSF